MKFDWNPEKNEWLKGERGISFEEIALLLGNGKLWKVMDHPDPKRYPNQQVFLVPVDGYIHFVPYVMEGEVFFLKTIFADRKATRDYRSKMEKRK